MSYLDPNYIVNARNEVISYLLYHIKKVIESSDRLNKNITFIDDVRNVSNRICFDYDIVVWVLLGNNPKRHDWGYLKFAHPNIKAAKYIINEEIENDIRPKMKIRNKFKVFYKVDKDSIKITLEIYDSKKYTNTGEKYISSVKEIEKISKEKDDIVKEIETLKKENKSIHDEMEIISQENSSLKEQLTTALHEKNYFSFQYSYYKNEYEKCGIEKDIQIELLRTEIKILRDKFLPPTSMGAAFLQTILPGKG
jgi:hypothetical protein